MDIRSNKIEAKSLWRSLTAAVLISGMLPAAGVAVAGEAPEPSARPAAGLVIDQQYVKAEAANIANSATFGYAAAIDGDTMIVGANNENTGAASSGAAYVYTKQGGTWQLQARLTPPNPQTSAYFGGAVGVSGDTIVVAASEEDGSITSTLASPNSEANKAGAVYVYVRSGGTWTIQAYLKASNAAAFDEFGERLAIDGDTIVVAATKEDGSSTSTAAAPDDDADSAGAVYVFVRSGTTWTQQAYLKASNADAGDYLGSSVDIDGDTLIAAAYSEAGNGSSPDDNSLTSAGAAYIFTRSDGVWTQQAYLKPLNQDQYDNFGQSVSIDGDYAAVGANYEQGDSSSTVDTPNNNLSGGAGAVYIFARNGVSWTQQAYIKASNAGEEDEFGSEVSLQGERLVVGAGFEDGSGSSTAASPNDAMDAAGAVYVFDRVGGVWQQNAYLKPSNIGAFDVFAAGAVAMDGDDLLVTSSGEDGDASSTLASSNNNASGSGAAYVFSLRSPALANLSLGVGALTPAFDPLITEYTMTVPLTVSSISIAPTVVHTGATFTVATAAGPCPSNVCALVEGDNLITVTVTYQLATRPAGPTAASAAGESVREYVIVASRVASTNAALSALALSAGALTPAFASATTAYTAAAPHAASSVTVTPTTEDETATAVVSTSAGPCASNACPLEVGENTITVTVTAQDAVTTRDYVLVVTRAASTNAALSALALSAGTLTPAFAAETTAYAATVPFATSIMTVTPTTADGAASAVVSASAGPCASNACALEVGANTITATVTAQDGVSSRAYVIVVTRQAEQTERFVYVPLVANKP